MLSLRDAATGKGVCCLLERRSDGRMEVGVWVLPEGGDVGTV